MPKLKTRSSVKKRFKLSKRGKVIPYGSANTSHIMSKKSAKRRRRLGSPEAVSNRQATTMRNQMSS